MQHSLTVVKQSVFWPKDNTFSQRALRVFAGVLLLAFASQLSIPLIPVPLTFQSVTVVLIGMAFGPRYAAAVISSYLILGMVGVPVFADLSAGSAKLFGPTMGYLLGFFPAGIIAGYLAQHGGANTILRSFFTALLGVSIIFLCGIAVLAQQFGFHQALLLGLLPFVGTELIKLMAVACIAPRFWK